MPGQAAGRGSRAGGGVGGREKELHGEVAGLNRNVTTRYSRRDECLTLCAPVRVAPRGNPFLPVGRLVAVIRL